MRAITHTPTAAGRLDHSLLERLAASRVVPVQVRIICIMSSPTLRELTRSRPLLHRSARAAKLGRSPPPPIILGVDIRGSRLQRRMAQIAADRFQGHSGRVGVRTVGVSQPMRRSQPHAFGCGGINSLPVRFLCAGQVPPSEFDLTDTVGQKVDLRGSLNAVPR